ncbi:MAG TPA: response regulator transcription factor [Chthoniobacterales bacterium]|jgi:two-component system NarL family response regulator
MQTPTIPLARHNGIARAPLIRGRSQPLRAKTLARENHGHVNSAFRRAPSVVEQPRAQIRLLIADDHALILEGLVAMISRQTDMVIVGKAADGREAVELWEAHRPDITVLDLRMPGISGVGAIRQIREKDASARVIVHTTYDTDEDIYQAVRAGAKGYLLKDAPIAELLSCVRDVHEGRTCIPSALAAKLAARMSGEPLTCREVDVLKLLAAGRSNKEIGAALFISETTVKSHVRGIFVKLNVLSRTEALIAASRRGYIRL